MAEEATAPKEEEENAIADSLALELDDDHEPSSPNHEEQGNDAVSEASSSPDVHIDPIVASFEGDTLQLKGGSSYTGEFKKNRMHGKGTYSWSDGVTFSGLFEKSVIAEGEGEYNWNAPQASTYKGRVSGSLGLRNGKGTFECTLPDGSKLVYTGDWIDGKRHGSGKQVTTSPDGQAKTYEGEWANGLQHGVGTMTYSSGNVYSGEWENGLKHGQGEMHWYDRNEHYKGEWRGGKCEGFGKHVWLRGESNSGILTVDSNSYSGQWKAGLRHGRGTFLYANGASYNGEWNRGHKQGQGLYVFEDGRIYSGPFHRDNMTGEDPGRGSSTEVDLAIVVNELVANVGMDKRRLKRELENMLLRGRGELKKLYATMETGEGNSVARLSGLWCFFSSRGFSRDGLSLAAVDRALARTKATRCALPQNIHDPGLPVLYREFLEVLVRLADVFYRGPNIVKRVKMLLDELRNRESEEREAPSNKVDVSALYAKCSSRSRLAEYRNAKDTTSSYRRIFKLLVASGIVVAKQKPEESMGSTEDAPGQELEDPQEDESEQEKYDATSPVEETIDLKEAMRFLLGKSGSRSMLDRELLHHEFSAALQRVAAGMGTPVASLVSRVKS